MRVIEAAGGLLWRPAAHGIEVALVHRPKYDDWSLPKGKLTRGEHPVLGALREVYEETGHAGVPGRPIGEIRYLKDGTPKRVRYWSMRAEDGRFAANAEVDTLAWLAPDAAAGRLRPERDQHLLAALDPAALDTWPCTLVRHASAGRRTGWPGPDRDRPLDEFGQAQAQALVPLLDAYRIEHVICADLTRCVDTMSPFARSSGVRIVTDRLLTNGNIADQPGLELDRLVRPIGAGVPTAVCAQGEVLPTLADSLPALLGPQSALRDTVCARLDKGDVLVMHLQRSADTITVTAVDRFSALQPA
jgi:8-oxo-dGTP diphosphatase